MMELAREDVITKFYSSTSLTPLELMKCSNAKVGVFGADYDRF